MLFRFVPSDFVDKAAVEVLASHYNSQTLHVNERKNVLCGMAYSKSVTEEELLFILKEQNYSELTFDEMREYMNSEGFASAVISLVKACTVRKDVGTLVLVALT